MVQLLYCFVQITEQESRKREIKKISASIKLFFELKTLGHLLVEYVILQFSYVFCQNQSHNVDLSVLDRTGQILYNPDFRVMFSCNIQIVT